MGFFKRKSELSLESLQPPIREGWTASAGPLIEIQIVGESNYQKHIVAISGLVGRDKFAIYLVPEPSNKYDKNAVAVFAGGACVGYIKRDSAAYWQQKALEARQRQELLVGTAVVRSASGDMYGVFGDIHHPLNPALLASIEPARLTPAKIKRAIGSLEDAFVVNPETNSQRKSQVNKALRSATALYAHVISFDPQDEDYNPALVEECKDFVVKVDASFGETPESGGPEALIDSFLDEWHFLTGSTRDY
jgi:hypothetical protein